MDSDELYEAIMKTTGARNAIAALIVSDDHKGARQRAELLNREDLISVVLLSAHELVGGYLTAVEQQLAQQGRKPEQAQREAREMALTHFRATAQMWSPGSGQDAGSGEE